MSANSAIEWCDHTFNPWWGCQRVSPGCEYCYAEAQAKRYGHAVWGPNKTTPRRVFGPAHWQEPMTWNRDAERNGVRRRVFCASMADVFEDNPNPGIIAARLNLWDVIHDTPELDWLVLTKRPENFARMLPWRTNPWPNVWLGTSVEDQQRADERIPLLLQTPATVRFLSCEPLLGPVSFRWAMWAPIGERATWHLEGLHGIDWIITGGESGSRARPCSPDWVRSIRDECEEYQAGTGRRVAFFHKQWGGRTHAEGGRLLDGRTWDEFPKPARELVDA